jgi:hypothetical protein
MVREARFRTLALSFEGAYEGPHFDRTAFRTKRRIFATLAADGKSANLMLDSDVQDAVCVSLPAAFSPVPGGWGRMGATTVLLDKVKESELVEVMREAHLRALPVVKAKKRK